MIRALEQKRLIYVTGKGGVGKSTITAALGRALAARGRRTLIVETDAFSAMPNLLGLGNSSEKSSASPRPAGDFLWTENLEASECFVKALTRFVPSERVARAIVQNKVARLFFKAAPSVNEFVILDQITELVDQQKNGRPLYDHVIVDLPASGHAVTFLSVPQTLQGMMKVGPIAKRGERIAADIRDEEGTAIVAVCLPEEMPVNETIDLAQNLEQSLGRGLTGAIINMLHKLPIDPARREVFEKVHAQMRDEGKVDANSIHTVQGPALGKLIAGTALALGWHDRDHHYMGLLRDRISAPVKPVPVIYDESSVHIVNALAEEIGRTLSQGA
jgi:anion-transporting  ArsA/GET3 family ATPase